MCRGALIFALLLPAAAPSARAGDAAPLSVVVLARSLAPGELARVVVDAPQPLAELRAKWLERDIFFVRESAPHAGEAERWSGWAVIGLAEKPGGRRLTVEGRAVGGRALRASLNLTVVPKKFPVDKLTVEQKFVEPPAEIAERIARERKLLGEIYARRSPLAPPASPFTRPVPGQPTSIFGSRRIFNGQPRDPHSGLDLRAASGTVVECAGPGTVALAQDLYYSGNTVVVDHGGGLFTLYAHLERLDVRAGEQVTAGQPIGASGATGRVTGPHLHWGGKVGATIFDPTALLDPRLFAEPAGRPQGAQTPPTSAPAAPSL